MARILVVEDSQTQALAISGMLRKAGFEVTTAGNGIEGLAAIRKSAPDLVLTDLEMPEMNGLELVEAIRGEFPLIPSVLMTALGSEEIAMQALQKGAASYVPKRNLGAGLIDTLNGVLASAQSGRSNEQLAACMVTSDTSFVLTNDCTLIPPLVDQLRRTITDFVDCDENECIRVGIALEESLLNALYFGNLEVRSDLAVSDPQAYHDLVEERLRQPPYRDRRIRVRQTASRDEATCVIEDEGPGGALTDQNRGADFDDLTSRSQLLIHTFMDKVTYNPRGNQITLVKRRRK